MMDWISILMVFVFGIAVGVLISSFLFESRIRFYREFIEHRLASLNRLRSQNAATEKSSKPSCWKTVFGHPPKHEEKSNSSQD